MLAKRWGVTPEWVSEVSRDPQRDLRYDDALYGVPDLHHLQRDLRQRARQVATAQAVRQTAALDLLGRGGADPSALAAEAVLKVIAQKKNAEA